MLREKCEWRRKLPRPPVNRQLNTQKSLMRGDGSPAWASLCLRVSERSRCAFTHFQNKVVRIVEAALCPTALLTSVSGWLVKASTLVVIEYFSGMVEALHTSMPQTYERHKFHRENHPRV